MTTNQTKRLLLLLLSGVLLFSGCQLLPADSSPEVEANPPVLPVDSAPGARDAAMLYIRDHYGLYVPPAGSAWNEQNLTPADVVSTSAFQFSLDHWIVNILFPTINPADIVYTISVHSPATGFAWEGLVDAHGNVTETRGYISPSSNNPANSPTIPPTSTSTTSTSNGSSTSSSTTTSTSISDRTSCNLRSYSITTRTRNTFCSISPNFRSTPTST